MRKTLAVLVLLECCLLCHKACAADIQSLIDRCAYVHATLRKASIHAYTETTYSEVPSKGERRRVERDHTSVSDGRRISISRKIDFFEYQGKEPYETRVQQGIFDGKQSYFLGSVKSKTENSGPALAIEPNPAAAEEMFFFSTLEDGFWRGFMQYEDKDVATFLKENLSRLQFDAEHVENINGIPCYRVELDSVQGLRTYWFAQEDGGSLVRAAIDYRNGDRFNGHIVEDEFIRHITYEVTSFIKEGDIWIPQKVNYSFLKENADGVAVYDEFGETTCTSVELEPDYQALECFEPNFPNQVPVRFRSGPSAGLTSLQWDANRKGPTAVPDERLDSAIRKVVSEVSSSAAQPADKQVQLSPERTNATVREQDTAGDVTQYLPVLVLSIVFAVIALFVLVRHAQSKPHGRPERM